MFPGWNVDANLFLKKIGDWLCVLVRPPHHMHKALMWHLADTAFRAAFRAAGLQVTRRMRGVNQEFMQARALMVQPAGPFPFLSPEPVWMPYVAARLRGGARLGRRYDLGRR